MTLAGGKTSSCPASSPSKTGVNALMCRASTSLRRVTRQDVDGRDEPGHDEEWCATHHSTNAPGAK